MIKRQRNQKGEGGRLRDELILAAMRILDRAPATQLSLRLVAREAGVAAPSVYPHFADARTMMAEIVEECWRQMGEEMAMAAQKSEAADALGRLKDKMAAFVHYAMERPSRYQLLFALQPIEPGADMELRGPLRPAYRQVLDSIESHLAHGGYIPAADAVSATLLTISLAHGRIALAHLAPTRDGNSTAGVQIFVLDILGRIFQPKC